MGLIFPNQDVDPPRIVAGSVDAILTGLDAHGLHWDGPVVYQSARSEAYAEVLAQLGRQLYPCTCTRAELRHIQEQLGQDRYPGTCRHGIPETQKDRPQALRLRAPSEDLQIEDLWQGAHSWFLPEARGDVVLQRADGVYTYPLAVVIDDAALGVTEVVRGFDLLEETPTQLGILHTLGYARPTYAHHPLVMQDGQKLSKQNLATPLKNTQARENLEHALAALGLSSIPQHDSADELLDWARTHWDPLQLRQHTAFILEHRP